MDQEEVFGLGEPWSHGKMQSHVMSKKRWSHVWGVEGEQTDHVQLEDQADRVLPEDQTDHVLPEEPHFHVLPEPRSHVTRQPEPHSHVTRRGTPN